MAARISATILLLVTTLLLLSAPAFASHTHVRLLGNGDCVYLAEDSGEESVVLPHADGYIEGRQHPLHVLVHFGQAGTRQGEPVVWVAGSLDAVANCAGYVNG